LRPTAQALCVVEGEYNKMRDPERINELLSLVKSIWEKEPDLRFNQLIYNLQYDYSQKNNGVGQVKEVETDGFVRTGFDFFNLEDNQFIEYLRSVASNERNM
jgi:uncharacterized protein YihD (DUF1040 family)